MSTAIHRLVYYSHNHIAGDEAAFEASVADILARSRENNLRDGITGALMFNAGCFAQVLEGPLEQIEAAFERIQQDDRHGDVSLLAVEEIPARNFPNWAMGFVGSSAVDATRFAAIGAGSGFNLSSLSGDEIHMLLRDLTITEEKAA